MVWDRFQVFRMVYDIGNALPIWEDGLCSDPIIGDFVWISNVGKFASLMDPTEYVLHGLVNLPPS